MAHALPAVPVGRPGGQHERAAELLATRLSERPGDATDRTLPPQREFGIAAKAPFGPAPSRVPEFAALGVSGSNGQPLPDEERRHYEARLGVDLGAVRVHTDSRAAEAARDLHARAFSLGADIAFGHSEFRPDARDGSRLLAHEIAHVVNSAGGQPIIGRNPLPGTADPGALVCRAAPEPDSVCAAPAALLSPAGPLADRIAAFKALVNSTAVMRLMANQQNLGRWSELIESVIPGGDLAALGLTQNVGAGALLDLQNTSDPGMRELEASQAFGRYRACTGCHIAKELYATRSERSAFGGQEWLTPNQQRAGLAAPGPFGTATPSWLGPAQFRSVTSPAPGYRPRPGTAEARLNELFPNPELALAVIERVRPIYQVLGPDGYQVLPATMLGDLENGSFNSLRTNIRAAMAQRSRDYGELIGKIQSGDLGYEHFAPIIADLLTTADPEVHAAIRDEMDSHRFWSRVEAVVVGVMTVAALLLAIFPPTSPAGVAALAALEVTLGTYGLTQGVQQMNTGSAYSLGTGANDVFTREQQQSGGFMMITGFVSAVLAPLSIAAGIGRVAGFGGATAGIAPLTLRAGETVRSGRYLVTMAEDGSLVATLPEQPGVMIVMRDGTVTVYEVRAGQAARVLESEQVLPPGGAAGRTGGGTPTTGDLPHVPQKVDNWCGAACGEMAAGRLGVNTSQEELAASRYFTPEYVAEGGQLVQAGGFQTADLAKALEELAPVAGRRWVGGTIQAMNTPAEVLEHMTGWLKSSNSSIILRVEGGNHWIIVDEVLADGTIAIRNPAAASSAVVTPQELLNMDPVSQAVLSLPVK
jgi:hypothetical protein